MRCPVTEVSCRGENRKFPELMAKMRLIVVAAAQRQLSPVNCFRRGDRSDHRLESPDPQKPFRRESDLGGKQLIEVPLAVPDLSQNIGDVLRDWIAKKAVGCVFHGRMTLQGLGRSRQQPLFDSGETLLWRDAFQQAVSNAADPY